MHMISKKDLSDAEMDTLTKSCSPTIVITANGEVQTHEEATVYVKELEKFLTVKVLENTPACQLQLMRDRDDPILTKPIKIEKQTKKRNPSGNKRPVVCRLEPCKFRHPGVAARIQRNFGG